MAAGDEILQMKKAAEETQPIRRTECPVDYHPLEKTEDGILHCPFCGWTDRLHSYPKRD